MSALSWNMPWLLLLALQPLVIFFLQKYIKHKQLTQYVSSTCRPWVVITDSDTSSHLQRYRNSAYIIAWVLFAIAAAGPRLPDTESGNTSTSQDIQVVLDISQSMHASDKTPSRLRLAGEKIRALVNQQPQSRIGVIVYAAKPHVYIPLSKDTDAINFYLANLNFLVPPSQGTKPATALNFAHLILKNNNQNTKSIILITDADSEENDNDDLLRINEELAQSNIPVFTLLMARKGGEAIPDFDNGWINQQGKPVISFPDIELYRTLSELSGGQLIKSTSTQDNSDISTLLDKLANRQHFTTNITNENWQQLFYLPLVPAIALLFFAMFPFRLSLPSQYHQQVNSNAMIVFFAALVAFSFSINLYADQNNKLRMAYQALTQQDYAKSREIYASIDSYDGRFGEAIASYRLADYGQAIRLFEQAVLLANTDQEYADALYNLGNSYFQVGNYPVAVSSYEAALRYRPQHNASIKNKIYAQRALQVIAERKEMLALATRAGRGPRSARAANNLVFSDNNTVSLDNGESDIPDNATKLGSDDSTIPEFIILRGLKFADKENQTATTTNKQALLFTPTRLTTLSKVSDNQAILWRRIFELEEGFPAPLDKPEPIPGVKPW